LKCLVSVIVRESLRARERDMDERRNIYTPNAHTT